jgi:hypothetical protein
MNNMPSNVIPFPSIRKKEKIVIKEASECEYKKILVDTLMLANQALFNLEFVPIIRNVKADQGEVSCSGCLQNDIKHGCRVKIAVLDILEKIVELPD